MKELFETIDNWTLIKLFGGLTIIVVHCHGLDFLFSFSRTSNGQIPSPLIL